MIEVSIDKKIIVEEEIKSCASLINRTWDAPDGEKTRIESMVRDAFKSVGRCESFLFGSELLKIELEEALTGRYIQLKQDFMTLLLRDYDGTHQFADALNKGMKYATAHLNRNLSEHCNFETESEIRKLADKYSDLDITPDNYVDDEEFDGHYFFLSVTPDFQEFISYDNVTLSLDSPSERYVLAEALITQAKLTYSHNNAVDIANALKSFKSNKFTEFPDIQAMPKSVQFLIENSGHQVRKLDPDKNGPVIDRLKELCLRTGPFISGGKDMEHIIRYMEYMPKDEKTGSVFTPF